MPTTVPMKAPENASARLRGVNASHQPVGKVRQVRSKRRPKGSGRDKG
jgi:hypothetical protein